jgi:hypothetical protein
MNNTIDIMNWFDLDESLWNSNAKWWVISKKRPDVALLKISPEEGSLIVHNYYIKDNLKYDYNGMSGYFPKTMLDTININRKNKISIDDIGISLREFSEDNYIDEQADNLKILLYNIHHLRNSNEKVSLLTARGDKSSNLKLVNILQHELTKINIKIDKIYFVGDLELTRHEGTTPFKKLSILIEHICGFKLKNDKFINEEQEMYNINTFYDDDDANCNIAKDVNFYIKKFYDESDDDVKIKLDKNLLNKKLIIHKITNNNENLFEITEIDINIFNN